MTTSPIRVNVLNVCSFLYVEGEEKMARKWTKISAENYIRKAKEKGLTYWSAIDFLKNHKTMHSII
jgi:hypothetical protein